MHFADKPAVSPSFCSLHRDSGSVGTEDVHRAFELDGPCDDNGDEEKGMPCNLAVS